MELKTPISTLGLVYRFKKSALEKIDILTIEDLLFHLPFRYEDYTNAAKIRQLRYDVPSVLRVTIDEINNVYTKRRFVNQKAEVHDETGTITCLWFNQRYLTRVLHKGDEVGIVGKLGFEGKNRVFKVEEYEQLFQTNGIHTSGFVPVYNETKGISSKWFRNRIVKLLEDYKDKINEFLPEEEIKKHHFKPLYDTITACHFPKSLEEARLARRRLAFDELLLSHISALKRKDEWNKKNKGIPFQTTTYNLQTTTFIESLPFELTDGQKQAIEDIKQDLQKDIPMNRLIEGDVGSGKTVVAAVAMYIAHLNGYQSALMAPTEILANQHYETIKKLFEPLKINVGLQTGSSKIQTQNNNQQTDILVGTHALIQKSVNFEKLGLVVIDEQQRFGVEQRAILREKGTNPHFLTMTATPIPRTVLLVIYKDLDVSLLKELPMGRRKIKTWLVPEEKRESGYEWIKKQIIESKYHDQAFIVCPFIEESESMETVKAAKKEFERLSTEEFKDLKLGLLHGKMKAKEKDKVLQDFKEKKTNILVSTPVVEVGIDIPDATIMVIEAADRFGLAQLHQLRGRVGRGDKQSYCLLYSESNTPQAIKRLKNMETAHSGFELAELDLKLRGGGDLFGTSQHGYKGLKIADFRDFELVEDAKKEAETLFKDLSKYKALEEKVNQITLELVNPD